MNKRAFSLLEIILVLFISSIVLIYSVGFTNKLIFNEYKNQKVTIDKIDLNSTKLFIEKNIASYTKLSFDGTNIIYDGSILLKNVSSFTMKKSSNILTIEILLDKSIKQTWKFTI